MSSNPNLVIDRIYIKNLSVEVPNIASLPGEIHNPKIDIDIRADNQKMDSGQYESSITFTIKAISGNQVFFLVQLTQAGLFLIRNVHEHDVATLLKHTCPGILFPFARKNIASMVINAGFQPVILNHINFDALMNMHFPDLRASRQEIAAEIARNEQQVMVPADTAALPEAEVAEPAAPARPEVEAPAVTLPEIGAGTPGQAKRQRPALIALFLIVVVAAGGFALIRHPRSGTATLAPKQNSMPAEATNSALTAKAAAILSLSARRFAEQPPGSYTLKVATLKNPEAILAWARMPVLRPLYAIKKGPGDYVMLYGIFATADDAQAAVAELPLSLQGTAQVGKVEDFSASGSGG